MDGDVETASPTITQTKCVVCNKSDKLLRCSQCKIVFYCTKEHQRRDWKRHKAFCTTSVHRPIESIGSTSDTGCLTQRSSENLLRDNYQPSNVPVIPNLTNPKTTRLGINVHKGTILPYLSILLLILNCQTNVIFKVLSCTYFKLRW